MNSFLREVAVFTCVLVLADFIKDWLKLYTKSVPRLFKQYRWKVYLWWKQKWCSECGRRFQWEYDESGETCRAVCNECLGEVAKVTNAQVAKQFRAVEESSEKRKFDGLDVSGHMW